MNRARGTVEGFLAACDVRINGPRATDIQVHDERLYARVMAQGSLGLGESYVEGWWDAVDLDGFITRLLRVKADRLVRGWNELFSFLVARLSNLQSRARAFQVGERHYDIGNDLYEAMLDSRMIYSCALWSEGANLESAQEAKLDLVFGKLGMKAGQSVLDIGCGWGGALQLAVERHRVRGTGITISQEQARLARRRCQGLPVEILLEDYRELQRGVTARFDHIWSIGMFEHVGPKNYRRYFRAARHCLAPEGRFLLHTIGSLRPTRNDIDPWIGRYIFPNAVIPRQGQICEAMDGLFRIDGWQRIGAHYDRTLLAWRDNLERYWLKLSPGRDEKFRRMWRYYLSASAAGFRAGITDVWQVLLSPC